VEAHDLFGPTLVERRGRLAREQDGQTRGRANRGADIDCRTRIAVGGRALAVFEEGLVARVWP